MKRLFSSAGRVGTTHEQGSLLVFPHIQSHQFSRCAYQSLSRHAFEYDDGYLSHHLGHRTSSQILGCSLDGDEGRHDDGGCENEFRDREREKEIEAEGCHDC